MKGTEGGLYNEPAIARVKAGLNGALEKNGGDLEVALSKFISDAWGSGRSLHLDKLRTDLTLSEWFHLMVMAPRESNLREVAMRKIEVELLRKCKPINGDPKFSFGILNTIDMKNVGLTEEQLLILCSAIRENRAARGDRKGWRCRGEFWKESPTSEVVLMIANTLHLSGKPNNCSGMLREAKEFREEAVEKSIAVYGFGP